MSEQTTELTSSVKGRHAELIAATALLANGYTVMESVNPESFDIAIKRADSKQAYYVQVKTAFLRNEKRYGGEYLVVRGAKNNGKVYTKDEVDFFIAVWDGKAYMFPNRCVSEYWIKPKDLAVRWTELKAGI